MKSLLLLAAIFIFAGCSSAPAPLPAPIPAVPPSTISFFTDVKGPSQESGDCGGYAFWLEEKDGRFVSGESAEFEGGCGIFKQPMVEVNHRPQEGKIFFVAQAVDSSQLLTFEGRISNDNLVGKLVYVKKSNKKPVNSHSSHAPRTFEKVDFQKFYQTLPQS